MNLASALIKRVLELEDFDTWMNVRKHYLPSEYHQLFEIINKHTDNYHKLPSIEELKLEIRDSATTDKVYALETIEVDSEPFYLLDLLKNDCAQRTVLSKLEKYIDESVSFESAEEVISSMQQIAIDLEELIETTPDEESMQKINLFDSEEEMAARITLGLNSDFDSRFNFRPSDYIMLGGKRGSGKSLTLSNIANNVIKQKQQKVLLFSIEMEPREVLQRDCAIDTFIPFSKLRDKNMNQDEWLKVVQYWANRYQDSESDVKAYLEHNDFNKFHKAISRKPLVDAYLEVVYDPNLTLGRIRAEVEKHSRGGKLGLVGIDYINKVKKTGGSTNQFDWTEQITISHAFKQSAQEYQVPHISPFQIDDAGNARFARGILDSCDAAFNLDAHGKDDGAITFSTVKMRGANDEEEFTSSVLWSCLKIGPASTDKPAGKRKDDAPVKIGRSKKTENIYDDQDAPF